MSTNDPQSLLRSEPLITFLHEAGVSRESTIRVMGPSALSAILWLCRHGYKKVGYARSLTCSDEAQALIVAHSCDELHLKAFLQEARRLPVGGAFVFQLRSSGLNRPTIQWLLHAANFSLEQWIVGERRILVIARRGREAARNPETRSLAA